MRWPIFASRKCGKTTRVQQEWERANQLAREKRQSRVLARGTLEGITYVSYDFRSCGCGVAVFCTVDTKGQVTVTRTEDIQCDQHEGEPR